MINSSAYDYQLTRQYNNKDDENKNTKLESRVEHSNKRVSKEKRKQTVSC
jgi:hypothetical protein